MVRARVLLAATTAGLMLFAGCSKSEDLPASRQLFGATPQIEQASLNPVETRLVNFTCDYTETLVNWVCSEGVIVEPDAPIQFTGTYTLAKFTVRVTDQDGVNDLLFVGASYSKPDSATESTLVLFDDGSANAFPQTQQLGERGEDCTYNPDTGTCSCQGKVYEVTSSDETAADGTFTRTIAFYAPTTPPPFIDCIMETQKYVGQFIESGNTLSFRIDAVDRAGNLDTWDTNLDLQIETAPATCVGDECGCCLALNTQGYTDICRGKPGMAGICQGF